MAPRISIIVPIYNAEKYIDRCMKAIYSQTFKDYEIILVNDGSTDNSKEMCLAYQSKDPRITFIDKKNEGAGSARNAGIEIARGEYLAFPDVDDWFEPEMYSELYQASETGKYDVVFSGVNYYKKNSMDDLVFDRTDLGKTMTCNSQEECRKNIMTVFPTTTIFDVPWNKLYKRSIAIEHKVRFSDTRRCQDAMFNIDFYNAIGSAISVGKAYYNYIENTNEDVQRKFPKNYIDINVSYFTKLISTLTAWGMYKDDIKLHYDSSFVIAVYGTMGRFDNPRWDLSKKEKKQYVIDIINREDVQKMIGDTTVKDDVKERKRIIQEKDYASFMAYYRKEKVKQALRKNRAIVALYHKLLVR